MKRWLIRAAEDRHWATRLLVSFLWLTLGSCSPPQVLRVGQVDAARCVPSGLLVDYVEQMTFLAIRDTEGLQGAKLEEIGAIEVHIEAARRLFDEYTVARYGEDPSVSGTFDEFLRRVDSSAVGEGAQTVNESAPIVGEFVQHIRAALGLLEDYRRRHSYGDCREPR